jgi:hypothetical protein
VSVGSKASIVYSLTSVEKRTVKVRSFALHRMDRGDPIVGTEWRLSLARDLRPSYDFVET